MIRNSVWAAQNVAFSHKEIFLSIWKKCVATKNNLMGNLPPFSPSKRKNKIK